MFEKIEIFDKRYSELSERLYQPSVAGNPEEYQKIMKEIKSIEEIVLTYRKYKEAVQTEKDSLEISFSAETIYGSIEMRGDSFV